MDPFADKVAFITGGASGIGRALGEELARRGARVVLADRDAAGADAVAAAIARSGGRARGVALDVCDPGAFAAAAASVAACEGEIDLLFNNAGVAIAGEVRAMQLADWNRLIDVNVRGVIHGVAAVYPRMIARRAGHIVNTASAAGLGPVPGMAIYAMTKHAVVGLSISLRGEARRLGVRVSAACPGFVRTPMLDNAPVVNADRELAFRGLPIAPVESCARAILRGVARDRAIIPYTPLARAAWLLYRLAPGFMIDVVTASARRNPLLAAPVAAAIAGERP